MHGEPRERPDGSQEIAARLGALAGRPEVSADYVRFRLDLLAAQRKARLDLAGSAQRDTRTGSEPSGDRMLAREEVAFPRHVLQSLFDTILASARANGRGSPDLERMNVLAYEEAGFLPVLAEAAAFGPDTEALESMARRHGVYVEALVFVGRVMAAPCMAEAAAARGHRGGEGPAEPNRCPACGAAPSIARLRREDGHRILTCGLCGTEWEAARLACPCCGTADHHALGVLRLGDTEARWVETCEVCRGYIKTVDERQLPADERVFPVLEETATLHFDLLAEREGYIRRVPYVLSG